MFHDPLKSELSGMGCRSHEDELVAQISVSNKSYGCVDGIHAKGIVKNSYFECFPVILYVSFIRYHPVQARFKLRLSHA